MFTAIMVVYLLAVLLIGIAWVAERNKMNGLIFIITLSGFFSIITPSYWKVAFSLVAAVAATYLLVTVLRGKKTV